MTHTVIQTGTGWRDEVATPDEVATDAGAAGHGAAALSARAGGRVDLLGVTLTVGGRRMLDGVSLSVEPGEMVALAGGSGAGKTTLLEAMAGMRRPSAGVVLHDGSPTGPGGPPAPVGFVPQDDIVHRDLPLRRTLVYAARLRLPRGTPAGEIGRSVDETLADLDLAGRAGVRVGALSGGQRKRASTAVELLARPRLLFLDEPTSGLDPATSADVVAVLRRLARRGVTVVLTTHDPDDIDACDRVVFLGGDGRVAFAGTPADARSHFGVGGLAAVYRRLAPGDPRAGADREHAAPATPVTVTPPVTATAPIPPPMPITPTPSPRGRRPRPVGAPVAAAPARVGALRQWAVLTRRNAELTARNRLTLAVLVGSPVLVTAMMAVLFRPGAFASAAAGSIGPAQTVFWIAFAGFFFGLTYGLLQVVGEVAVVRRERFAGVSTSAYVLSKVAMLLPLLAVVAAGLLGVLRALDRLPAAGPATYATLFGTLVVESLAALALGLLASALVADAAQATLTLPMLCFPQVLFAGAVVPVGEMAGAGRAISLGMANRWGFEALGRTLRLDSLSARVPGMAGYRAAFTGGLAGPWALLLASAVVLTCATVAVLRRRFAVR